VQASADPLAFAKAHRGSKPHSCSVPGRRAQEGVRKKDRYFNSQFHRIRARRGPKKAIVAVAASILTAIMLGTIYHDLEPNHFDRRTKEKQKESLGQKIG
jgi:hypothetical protein